MVLDFTTLTQQELAAYFGEGDLRHAAGYSDYEVEFRFQEGNAFKNQLTGLLNNQNFQGGISVLELGGARGHMAEFALDNFAAISDWEIIDIYDSPFKKTHADLIYNIGDVSTLLPTYGNKSKDVILSFRFLECIPESKLGGLITEMNRVTKTRQVHITGTNENTDYYNSQPLDYWLAQPFKKGTVILDTYSYKRGRLENMVVV